MPESSRKFNYSVPTHKILVTLTISIVLTLYLAYAAMGNDRALDLFITLDTQETTGLLWFVTALSLLAASLIAATAYGALTQPPKVELDADKASVPKASLLGGQIDMPYETIDEVSRRKVTKRDEMLVIKSTRGESRLLSNHFKSPSEYEDFIAALRAHLMDEREPEQS